MACSRGGARPPSGPVVVRVDHPLPLTVRGFNYAHLHRPGFGYGSARSAAQRQRLFQLGVRDIALNPFAYQPDLHQPSLQWGGDPTLSLDALRAEAMAIRSMGMRVHLKPHLWSWSFSGGLFPGDIEMGSSSDWQRWFERYAGFVEEIAALAQEVEATCL